jgi:hypothetical protein
MKKRKRIGITGQWEYWVWPAQKLREEEEARKLREEKENNG